MSYPTVLVHLDDTARCAVRVRLAIALASQHGSHLVGLAPTGLVNLPPEVGPLVLNDVQEELRRVARRQADRFAQQADSAGLPSFETAVLEDEPLPAMVMRARSADLVVLGQSDPQAHGPLTALDFPEQVLLHAGRPVLVVPKAGEFETVGQRVLIGWNPARETTRAIADALPLLRKARHVHLLMVDPGHDPEGTTRQQLAWAQAWLQRHGVIAACEVIGSPAEPGLALLSEAADRGADLLVMGGYGHARATEFIFGGTTRTVLARMNLPVLMSH